MRKTVPRIQESADELKTRLKQETHPGNHQRLHALYLVASQQARYRKEVADLLGVSRNTVGRWFAAYATGGIPALLTRAVHPGRTPALSKDQLVQLQQALQRPDGFASYAAIQHWILDTFGVAMSYNAVQKLVRNKLGAKPKVPRPSHQKKR